MRGQRHSGEGIFGANFEERKLFFSYIREYVFWSVFFGLELCGLLHGCINCWGFWAWGPGILTES